MFGDIFHALTIIWTSLITILFSCIGQQHATRGSAQQQENEHEAHSTFNTYLFIVVCFGLIDLLFLIQKWVINGFQLIFYKDNILEPNRTGIFKTIIKLE